MNAFSNAPDVAARGARWVAVFGGLALFILFLGVAISVAEVNAVLLFASLLACAFIFMDFRIGVVLLIVFMPISTSYLFPHQMAGVTGLNPLNLLLFATLVACLLRARAARKGLPAFAPPSLVWLYLVPFVVAGYLGSLHVDQIAFQVFTDEQVHFHDQVGYLRDLVLRPFFFVLFALLVGRAAASSREPERFIVPAIVSIWVIALVVVVYVAIQGASLAALADHRAREFLTPLGMHANMLGRLFATAYALLLFTWAATERRGLKVALIVTMLLVVAALVFTFSRGAFYAFVAVNVIFVLTRRKIGALAIGVFLVMAIMIALPGALYDRVTVGFDGDLNILSAGRTDSIWEPLLPELWRSPLIGNGLSAILWSDAMRNGAILQVTHAHNAYMEGLLNMGAVGLALVLVYFIRVGRDFFRMSRDPALNPTLRGFFEGAMAGLVSFMLAGVAGSALTPCPDQSFLWLAIGMLYGVRGKSGNNKRAA